LTWGWMGTFCMEVAYWREESEWARDGKGMMCVATEPFEAALEYSRTWQKKKRRSAMRKTGWATS